MLKFVSHFSKVQNYKIIYIKSVFGFIRKAKYSLREYCHINHKSFRDRFIIHQNNCCIRNNISKVFAANLHRIIGK